MYCKTRNQTVNLTSIKAGDFLLIEEWNWPVTTETAATHQSTTKKIKITKIHPRYIRADWCFMNQCAEVHDPVNHFVARIIRKI